MDKVIKICRNLFTICYCVFLGICVFSFCGQKIEISNKLTSWIFFGLTIFCFLGSITLHSVVEITKKEVEEENYEE